MDVVVLAAGLGARLGPLGAETPKWLLRVGTESIAERQLDAIEAASRRVPDSIRSVGVVTGHGAEAIGTFLRERDSGVANVENGQYARRNNWYSVLVGLRSLESPSAVIVVNGDLVAPRHWMSDFIVDCVTRPVSGLIAVDLERPLTDESMNVATRPSATGELELEKIGKIGVEDPRGEYIGMLMARGPLLGQFRETLESFAGDVSAEQQWYEAAVLETADRGASWTIWPTPDDGWIEIDDADDHSKANQIAQALGR